MFFSSFLINFRFLEFLVAILIRLLSSNDLKQQGFEELSKIFASLKDLMSLKLYLSQTGLGDASLELLTKAMKKNLTYLRVLHLDLKL